MKCIHVVKQQYRVGIHLDKVEFSCKLTKVTDLSHESLYHLTGLYRLYKNRFRLKYILQNLLSDTEYS